MAGFNLVAKFGVDATGVKAGVDEAVRTTEKGARQMEQAGERVGRGFEKGGARVSVSNKKLKYAVTNIVSSIGSGGDIASAIGGSAVGLGSSLKGAIGIGIGAAVLAKGVSSLLEMRKAAIALNKDLTDLSQNGMSLSGQTAENLSGQIQALTGKLKESTDTGATYWRSMMEGVNGFFGGSDKKDREKAESKAKADQIKATDNLISKLEGQLAVEEKIIAGDKLGAEMDALAVKQQEQLTSLAARLGDSPGFQKIRKAEIELQDAETRNLKKQQQKEIDDRAKKLADDQAKQAKETADALTKQAEKNVQNRANPNHAARARDNERAIAREKRAIGARERDKADRAARNGGNAEDFLNGGLKGANDDFFDNGVPIGAQHNQFLNHLGPVSSRDFRGLSGSHPHGNRTPDNGKAAQMVTLLQQLVDNTTGGQLVMVA